MSGAHATIWLADNETIALRFPSPVTDRTHDIKIPINEHTTTAIREILRARANEAREEFFKIGHRAAPTQYDLEKILQAISAGKIKVVGKKKEVKEDLTLEEIGL